MNVLNAAAAAFPAAELKYERTESTSNDVLLRISLRNNSLKMNL